MTVSNWNKYHFSRFFLKELSQIILVASLFLSYKNIKCSQSVRSPSMSATLGVSSDLMLKGIDMVDFCFFLLNESPWKGAMVAADILMFNEMILLAENFSRV